MNRILLFILAAFCTAPLAVKAQSFSIQADTVWTTATVGGVTHSYDTIATPAPVTLSWRVLSTNFPSDWLIDSVLGICDANLCRQNNASQLWDGTSGTTFTCTYPSSSGSHDFHLQLDLQNVTSVGTYYMVVRVDDPVTTLSRRMTFIITNGPSAVANVNNGISGISVFPNPSPGTAHITFNLSRAQKVQCAVYDIAGRKVLDAANEFMKPGAHQVDINTRTLAPGIYNVILATSSGIVSRQLIVK